MFGNDIVDFVAVGGDPNPHTGKRGLQKIAHREALLEAGVRVLGAETCACVAVDKIAAQAGLAKGTVYNYFGDKARFVEAVTQSVEARAADRIAQAMGSLPTGRARVAAAMCAMLETAILHPEEAVILERRIGAAPGDGAQIGEILFAELRRGGFDRAGSEGAQRAAVTLVLSATCAGMRQFASGHWGTRETHALIAQCLAALGVGRVEAAREASVALSRSKLVAKRDRSC